MLDFLTSTTRTSRSKVKILGRLVDRVVLISEANSCVAMSQVDESGSTPSCLAYCGGGLAFVSRFQGQRLLRFVDEDKTRVFSPQLPPSPNFLYGL